MIGAVNPSLALADWNVCNSARTEFKDLFVKQPTGSGTRWCPKSPLLVDQSAARFQAADRLRRAGTNRSSIRHFIAAAIRRSMERECPW